MQTAVSEKPLQSAAVLAALQYQVTQFLCTAVNKATVILIIRKIFFPVSKNQHLTRAGGSSVLGNTESKTGLSIRNHAVGWGLCGL